MADVLDVKMETAGVFKHSFLSYTSLFCLVIPAKAGIQYSVYQQVIQGAENSEKLPDSSNN